MTHADIKTQYVVAVMEDLASAARVIRGLAIQPGGIAPEKFPGGRR